MWESCSKTIRAHLESQYFCWGTMKSFGIYSLLCAVLIALIFCSSDTIAGGKSSKNVKDSKSQEEATSKSSSNGKSASSATRGLPSLPSLDGLTHGLGLGLRKRRALPLGMATPTGNKGTSSKKPTDKDSTCGCPTKSDPVCASDGKSYLNKCMFQCEMKKSKSKSKKPAKDSKKKESKSPPPLKIVKKGKCNASPDSATTEPTTTTASPLDMVHHTVTELSNTAHETLAEHDVNLPMMSMSTSTMMPAPAAVADFVRNRKN